MSPTPAVRGYEVLGCGATDLNTPVDSGCYEFISPATYNAVQYASMRVDCTDNDVIILYEGSGCSGVQVSGTSFCINYFSPFFGMNTDFTYFCAGMGP